MLPKKNRLDTKTTEEIFKKGIFLNSPSLTFKFIKNKSLTSPRISFIAPKSVSKLAVKRNSLRRKGYTALIKHIKKFPVGITGAFIFRKPESDVSTLENEIKIILTKIN